MSAPRKKQPEVKAILKKFIVETSKSETLFGSTCSAEKSGCHTFCKALLKNLNSNGSHIKIVMTGALVNKLFFDEKSIKKPFSNIVMTGCIIEAKTIQSLIETLSKYVKQVDFSKLSSAYIVYPPHRSTADTNDTFVYKPIKLNESPYSLTTITSGIGYHLDHCIGLPNLNMEKMSGYSIPAECYGLLYINNFIDAKTIDSNNKSIMSQEDYLALYFFQVKRAAQPKIKKPSVIAVTDHLEEKKLINSVAEFSEVSVRFVKNLEQEYFNNIMRLVSEKGGVIGQNGILTLLESLAMDALTFAFANIQINFLFYDYMISHVDSSLKEIAQFVLGRSDKHVLVEQEEKIKAVHSYFSERIKASFFKFKELTEQKRVPAQSSTEQPSHVCSSLKKITGLEWTYDEKTKIATALGEFHPPTYEKLAQIFNAQETVQSDVSRLTIDFSLEEDIQKLSKLAISPAPYSKSSS